MSVEEDNMLSTITAAAFKEISTWRRETHNATAQDRAQKLIQCYGAYRGEDKTYWSMTRAYHSAMQTYIERTNGTKKNETQ